jgi:hypothetical protein
MVKAVVGPNPAVETARERSGEENGIVILSTGVKARLRPVAASLIDEVQRKIVEPEIPTWNNPDKPTTDHPEGRPEPHPADPAYIKAKREADSARGYAAIDAMVLFGVDLVEGIPEHDSWLEKLKYLEKRGLVDLSAYDLQDPFERDFLYKRFVALGSEDLTKLAGMMGIPEAAVKRAAESFPGPETRPAD